MSYARVIMWAGCNAYYTKVELELVLNADVYLLFEKGLRGGVSSILRSLVNPTRSI